MKRIPLILAAVSIASGCSMSNEPVAVQAVAADQSLVAEAQLSTPTTFEVAPGSKVWFVIDEMFRGSPKTVVGVNPKVDAQVVADLDDPSSVVLSPIVVKSAFFDTEPGEEPAPLGGEIGWRDTAINRYILDSNEYPVITFTPSAVVDLSGTAEGQSVEIAGDLTVRDITRRVTFATTFNSITSERVDVTGSTTVLRSDFDLEIPNVAHIADVANELLLEFDLIFEPAGTP